MKLAAGIHECLSEFFFFELGQVRSIDLCALANMFDLWARSSRCCGLALSHGLVLYIGITSCTFPPWTELSKKNYYDYDFI